MTETATHAQAALTRTVDRAELPVPGTYAIDASHSAVEFAVRHLGLAKVRGSSCVLTPGRCLSRHTAPTRV